jgi:ABC-type amino acid transport substrate-binding protein
MRGKNMLFPRRLCVLITITISVIFCNITDAGEAEETLRVGISPFAPFVILSGDQPIGVSIDIWHAIADKLRIEYEYVESEGVDGKLKNLKEGKTVLTLPTHTITPDLIS